MCLDQKRNQFAIILDVIISSHFIIRKRIKESVHVNIHKIR